MDRLNAKNNEVETLFDNNTPGTLWSNLRMQVWRTSNQEEGLKSSDLIIYGKVISTELIPFSKTIDDRKIEEFKEALKGDKKKLKLLESDWILKVEIIVKEKVKGEIRQDTVIIYTARSSASCGYRFEKGLSYRVYAKRQSYLNVFFLNSSDRSKHFGRENTFWTNQCTLTSEYHPQ